MILEHFYLGKPKPEGPITATTPLRFVKAYTEQYKPIRVELEMPVAPVVVAEGESAVVRLADLRVAVYEVAGADAFALMEPSFWDRLRFDATVRAPVRASDVERHRFGAERIFDHDGRFDHWRQSIERELVAGQEVRAVYPVHTEIQVFGPGSAHDAAQPRDGFGDWAMPTRERVAIGASGRYRFVKDWSPARKVDTANVDAEGSHLPPLYLEVSPPSPPYRRIADFGGARVGVTARGPDFSGLSPNLKPYLESWAAMLVREFLAWQMPALPVGS
ncbi:MAG: hypothetical protein HY332_03315 [Chloroflexi bacterium]|nr:hypothetical protein [Chloroflexota bacterium]